MGQDGSEGSTEFWVLRLSRTATLSLSIPQTFQSAIVASVPILLSTSARDKTQFSHCVYSHSHKSCVLTGCFVDVKYRWKLNVVWRNLVDLGHLWKYFEIIYWSVVSWNYVVYSWRDGWRQHRQHLCSLTFLWAQKGSQIKAEEHEPVYALVSALISVFLAFLSCGGFSPTIQGHRAVISSRRLRSPQSVIKVTIIYLTTLEWQLWTHSWLVRMLAVLSKTRTQARGQAANSTNCLVTVTQESQKLVWNIWSRILADIHACLRVMRPGEYNGARQECCFRRKTGVVRGCVCPV